MNSRHRGTEAKKHIYSSTEAQRQRGTEAKKHRGTEAKTLRASFSATVELLLIRSPRSYIIFDFQQLLLMTNFDQTHGYGDGIEAMFFTAAQRHRGTEAQRQKL